MHWSLWLGIFALCIGLGGYGIYCVAKPEEASANLIDSPEDVAKKGLGVTVVSAIVLIIALICLFTGSCGGCTTSTSKKDNTTCKVCHRTFKKGSGNAKSISKRNMCENCYENYQWRQEVQDYIDNQPIN